MKGRKIGISDIHYYSERLKYKLNNLLSSPAVIVEAPSGYGKTTAVRDYLENSLPQGIPVYWFTAVAEAPESSYKRLCLEIKKIDAHAGDVLLRIGLPNAFTIGETCETLRTINCNSEAWLVIDNFQYLNEILMPPFLSALLEHVCTCLHIVIITQVLARDIHSVIAGRGYLHITTSDMRLDAADVQRYFALASVKISKKDAQDIVSYTEGWIIALYLQLRAYLETGAFSDTAIISLMESLVWERLTKVQQTFLLHLSTFEMITVQQSCFLAGLDTLPSYAVNALQSPFIRYDRAEFRYEFHSILSELLAQKFKECGRAFVQECFMRAGDWCRYNGKIPEAVVFYLKIKDYRGILSTDFTDLIFDEIDDKPFSDVALEIMQNCPAEIKKEYPLSMLRIAWALKAAGMDVEFAKLLEEIDLMLEPHGLLRAEWLLLSAYKFYPYICKMVPFLKKAAPMFEGKSSQVILPSAPWCFGDYSQMSLFHRNPGEGDREAEEFEEFISLYSKLTNGHGSGADSLFRAELAHYRGDLDMSEIFIHKAIFLAESYQQSIVQLGANLQLCEIAVERCDSELWDKAFNSMEHAATFQNNAVIRTVLDIVRGLLLNEIGHQAQIADFMKNADQAKLIFHSVRYLAMFEHVCYLMHEEKYAQMAGVAQAVRDTISPDFPFGDAMLSLMVAIGYFNIGDKNNAIENLNRSMEQAIPDGFLYIFAVHHWMFQGLTEEIIAERFPENLKLYRKIKDRFFKGYKQLHTNLLPNALTDSLTARELEIAVLASKGLRNSEIAKKLIITESTVRTHLHSAFQKLDIDRRSQLAEKLLQKSS